MNSKTLLAGIALFGSLGLSAYTYEVQPLIGQNFTEDGAAVDDSTAFGLRLNKYISKDNAIMFGYTHINDADYNKQITTKGLKSLRCNTGCEQKPNPSESSSDYNENHNDDNSDYSSDNHDNSASSESNDASQNANSANNAPTMQTPQTTSGSNDQNDMQPHAPVGDDNQVIAQPTQPKKKLKPNGQSLGNLYKKASTDIDRFYINGLHNITTNYNRLTPYVYAGFGYERVDKEYNDYRSQGFFDAGMGLKFGINDRVSLLADLQGIKKFRDNDLDILASIGLGFFFGADHQAVPEKIVEPATPVVAPKREVTIIKVHHNNITVAPKEVKEEPMTIKEKATGKGSYYIQLETAFKTDIEKDSPYVKKLKKEGIDYDIKYVTVKGKNAARLVTGPYSSKAEAKEELAKMREISKGAFIVKIK